MRYLGHDGIVLVAVFCAVSSGIQLSASSSHFVFALRLLLVISSLGLAVVLFLRQHKDRPWK